MANPRLMRNRDFAVTLRAIFLGVVILGAALIVGLFSPEQSFDFSAQAIEETIRSWGMWGVLASIVLMIVHSFVPFPAELIAVANGMVYGPVWGTVITWTGAMLGAFLAFGLARTLGRPFVERMVTKGNRRLVDDWAYAQGGKLLLMGRLIPVISFNLINYAAGLTRISWWTFAWATGVGILPLTVLMVVMGHHIQSLAWDTWLLLLSSGLVLWFLILWFLFRRKLQPSERSRGRLSENDIGE